MSDRNVIVLKGVQTEYFRLQGSPHDNYNKDGTEWSSNFILNKEHLKQLKEAGCGSAYIKTNDDGEKLFKFKQRAQKKDGSPAKPPLVRDKYRKIWPANVLVGNGSVADIVVTFNEMKAGPNKGKLRPHVLETAIKEHVPYEVEGGIEYEVEEVEESPFVDDEVPTFEDDDEWEDA